MLNSPPLGPGLSVEIEVIQRDHTVRCTSRILDADARGILLAQPLNNGWPVVLRSRQPIIVYLQGEGGLWYFDTRVQRVYRIPHPMLLVPRPAKLTRRQQRQCVRGDVQIVPERFALLDVDRHREYSLQATIVNVSGGGVKFISPILVPQGVAVKMVFELPEGYGEVRAMGVVVHNRLVPQSGNVSYAMGVAFTQISNACRGAIIRLVLHHQAQRSRAR